MPPKTEAADGGKGARRMRAGKRIHENTDEGVDDESNSDHGSTPSPKQSRTDKREIDSYVPSWINSKQRHRSKSRGAAALRKSIVTFEGKLRRSRSRTPKSRLASKECDDGSAGERSEESPSSRSKGQEGARSPSTTRKDLDHSSRITAPNAEQMLAKNKEAFNLHRRLSRSSNNASDLENEDAKQAQQIYNARTQKKGKDRKSNRRLSLSAGNAPDPSSFKLKRRESRDEQAQFGRHSSINESTLCRLLADMKKEESDSKEKRHDINERRSRRKNGIERRHSDITGKSLIIDRKEVMRRRNSMTENEVDLLRQSRRLNLPRSTSTASLKESFNSADIDAINAFSTLGNRSESKAGTKDNTPSLKDTSARLGRKSIPEAKAPSKTTVKEIPQLRTISKDSPKEGRTKDKRKSTKPPIETASPVGSITFLQESKGIHVSRVTMCAICVLYIVSLALMGVLGFWLHMIFYANNHERHKINGTLSFGIAEKNELAIVLSSISYAPSSSSSTGEPTIILNQLLADSKRPPPSSVIPTITLQPTSSPPTTISHNPSVQPSYMPSTSFPTFSPSTSAPTLSRMPSLEPSTAPSTSMSPSSSPTGIPKCPDKLLKIADLGEDSLITMRYEIIPLPLSDPYGGLFCVSIEHEGNAGWIGFAVSEASRDPAFGRKEAIIGIPGVMSMVAAAPPGADVAVGQQVGTSVLNGPTLFNPGKYEIPAGGVDGYAFPSIDTMLPPNRQTLGNATVAIIGPDDNPLQKPSTTMTFTKFLREPNDIEIDPFKSTLFVYAVATIDEDGEYNDNPEWLANYITLLESETTVATRKRLRGHKKETVMFLADETK